MYSLSFGSKAREWATIKPIYFCTQDRFLATPRAQFYIGGDVNATIKKPLNAFLGELFIASWKDENALESKIVTEQVR